MANEMTVLAVSVGNTRTALGAFEGETLLAAERLVNTELDPIVAAVERLWAAHHGGTETAVALASVNDPVADRLARRIEQALGVSVRRIERDLAVPVGRCVDRETIVGQDRLLNAAAAFDRMKQACVVVDVGTAVTVDFVDGEGTFHGGAIAPGAQMQLDALHERTAQLPAIDFVAPDAADAFGANTRQAMLQGVFYGVRGMVRHLAERYAEAYQAYPAIVATGGDAHTIFDGDDLVEHIVDDLTLRGIALTCRMALEGSESD